MIHLTDTHCHIHEAVDPGDTRMQAMWAKAGLNADDMIAEAKQFGVTRLVCVGTSLANSQSALDFAGSRDNCWATVGLHPHEAKDGQVALDGIVALASKPKVVAIGEIGLDYFYSHSNKDQQVAALRFQIELALKHDLPIIFHVRDAFDDFWPIFDSYQNIRGVLHSFTDSYANFTEAMQRGLYIGINGIMTFTKVEDQLRVAKEVPLQKLLLETDAPFLTPKPHRGTVNMPAHLRLVADFLADLRGEPVDRIAAHTSQNAQTLFSLS